MVEVDWESLVSSRVGVITQLTPQHRSAEEPVPPYLYTAMLSHFDFRRGSLSERLNAGKGRTELQAKLSAIGEAVERYCAYHIGHESMFNATAVELQENKISPEECVLYKESQYALAGFIHPRFSENVPITWVHGIELPSQSTVAVPASLAYLFDGSVHVNGYFTNSTSNGLAAGGSLEFAILGGLYELIERDAFLITWMNQLPVPEIEIPQSGVCGAIARHYLRFGVNLRLFLLHTDQHPHVVMAVSEESCETKPARVVGLGCDLSPHVAIEKAIFELCQARASGAIRLQKNKPQERLKSEKDVLTLEDHADFYALHENKSRFDFLAANKEVISPHLLSAPGFLDAKSQLNYCVQRLSETGHRVAYFELTTADILTTGFRVVRTFATGLQPIHFGFGSERLGGSRLFEAPVSWGLLDRPHRCEELNSSPHPLA